MYLFLCAIKEIAENVGDVNEIRDKQYDMDDRKS